MVYLVRLVEVRDSERPRVNVIACVSRDRQKVVTWSLVRSSRSQTSGASIVILEVCYGAKIPKR